MALSEKLISFILLMSLFSSQIHARESHFFSKIPQVNNVQETNNSIKDAQLPRMEHPLHKQNPEPQPKENSYGLYGLENSQATNYAPYITTADGGRIHDLNKDPLLKNQENLADTKFKEEHVSYNGESGYHPDQKEERFSGISYTTRAYNDNDNYYNGHTRYSRNEYNYDEQPNFDYKGDNQLQDFKEAIFADNGYNTISSQNNYQNNGGNKHTDVLKQVLSATRFLENGRYFYDVSKGKYNPNQYDNNGENKKNYMGGHHNHEEFQENDAQFMP